MRKNRRRAGFPSDADDNRARARVTHFKLLGYSQGRCVPVGKQPKASVVAGRSWISRIDCGVYQPDAVAISRGDADSISQSGFHRISGLGFSR